MGDNVGVPAGYCAVLAMKLALPLTPNQSYYMVEIKGFSRLALVQEGKEYEEMLGIVAANRLREDCPQSMGLAGGNIRWSWCSTCRGMARIQVSRLALVSGQGPSR